MPPPVLCAHFPFGQSAPVSCRSAAAQREQRSACLPTVSSARQLLAPRARATIDPPPPPPQELGERWGARLARLGLLLVHCLLRPFLTAAAPSERPMRPLPSSAPSSPSPSLSPSSPHKALAAAVLQRLSMDLPASGASSGSPTNSSSEPSPQAADSKPKPLLQLETKRAPSPPPSPKMLQFQPQAPEQEQDARQQQQQAGEDSSDLAAAAAEQERERDELDELQQALLRKSTGSVAIMTRQQEALDHRRHTFSAMSADGRANARRRSYDLTPQFGSTFPPSSPPQQSLPHSFKAHHHMQHLRVYGKSSGPAKLVSECHEEGAPLVALVSPGPDTVWTRGKPVQIEWKVLDAGVHKLCIELLEDGLSATTLIAKEAPNTGFFTYHRVPWGMESGSKYFLRVSAADAPERYRTSSFFQISSAP
ncbi:Ser-Thr-rich glycosyl-phosphatidyl-inositol-anchored membrane family [Phytophthora cinnamomi]|uniref:Ser-Thr-rich glycosyl-phosphatidyl-inositol-anchored membrane family n=1 Tax=Phytophthora cinnamomi TaxID=4785 RepID=UPI003559CEA5|nr:Ser-Thr-rich glycosyl-phosphatidyl-inositol-anchored membrane family [Phytophthora cinnamomi]